jgi:hypothetical protein
VKETTKTAYREAKNNHCPDLPDSPEWSQEPIPLARTPTAAPFPVEVFPGPVARLVVEGASTIGVPPDFLGLPALAVAGGAVGSSRTFAPKFGWAQSSLLYAAVVGPPGDGKTPALSAVAKPIYEAQHYMKEKYAEEMEWYRSEMEKFREAKKGKKPPKPKGDDDDFNPFKHINTDRVDPGDLAAVIGLNAYDEPEDKPKDKPDKGDKDEEKPREPDKPHMGRVVVDDITVEAVAKVMEENGRGVVMIKDELVGLVTSCNQYKGGRGSDRQFWLSNWAGCSVTVDRKGRDVPYIVPHPFCGVVGGMAPDLLAALRDDKGRSDGFLDRFVFSYPDPSASPSWSWHELDDHILGGWRRTLQALLALNQVPGENGLRPELLRLAQDAREAWQEAFNGIVADRNRDDFPAHLKGPWAKLQVYLARLSLIVHLMRFWCRETEEKDVDAESVRRASVLVGYFKTHIMKVYATIGADPEIEDARRVLEWIARENRREFKRWEIHKDIRNESRFPRIEDVDPPLSRLCKHNYVRVKPSPDKQGRGRPADPVYEVNPLWDRREYRVNRVNSAPDGKSPDLPDGLQDHGDAWEG